jgi:Family of unknown function (DUF6084)
VKAPTTQERPPGTVPDPEFAVAEATHLLHAAAPTLVFSGTVADASGCAIQSMALVVQAMIDPARRSYDPETRARLAELFGAAEAWAPPDHGLHLARLVALVPAFTGAGAFSLDVPCTYDLEVAAAKYFYALDGGVVPMSFHFNGTILYRDADARLQVVPVPWSATARFRMRLSVWRAMMDEYYPGGGWVRLQPETLAALNAHRSGRGLHSFDAAISELLAGENA